MGRLFYLQKSGKVIEIANGLVYPNGIAIHKDALFVSEHLNRRVLKFEIKANGTIDDQKIFTDFKDAPRFRSRDPQYTGPDGIEISKSGKVYIAEYARGRILVYALDGKYHQSIHVPMTYVTNMAIDKKRSELVITGASELTSTFQFGKVIRRKLPAD